MGQEIIFQKSSLSYSTYLVTGDQRKPQKEVFLDTGSPISVISIPSLLQLTNEPLFLFRKSVDQFLSQYMALEIGGYDMESNQHRYRLIPYIVNCVTIGGVTFHPFMFWVNITNYLSRAIKESSILFGLDYINQGRKWFDNQDDFHITFEEGLICDTDIVGAALKQPGQVMQIKTLQLGMDIV